MGYLASQKESARDEGQNASNSGTLNSGTFHVVQDGLHPYQEDTRHSKHYQEQNSL